MNALRKLLSFGVSVICLGLIGSGMVFSSSNGGEGIILSKPGEPGRLQNEVTSATAFFEFDGNMMELTMLYTDPQDPNSVSRRSVRLTDGQSHTIVVGGDGESGVTRFLFRRVGYSVEMRQAQSATLQASLISWNGLN